MGAGEGGITCIGIYKERKRERERERERERDLKVWYITLVHRQAWCFTNVCVRERERERETGRQREPCLSQLRTHYCKSRKKNLCISKGPLWV